MLQLLMEVRMPKYTISDISKGMKEDDIIGYIGKETNAESDALYSQENIITPVYNDSIEDFFYHGERIRAQKGKRAIRKPL